MELTWVNPPGLTLFAAGGDLRQSPLDVGANARDDPLDDLADPRAGGGVGFGRFGILGDLPSQRRREPLLKPFESVFRVFGPGQNGDDEMSQQMFVGFQSLSQAGLPVVIIVRTQNRLLDVSSVTTDAIQVVRLSSTAAAQFNNRLLPAGIVVAQPID